MSIPAIIYEDSTKKDKRFHKQGTHRLTRYEFACGYTQESEKQCCIEGWIRLVMWMEHGTFHVRAHDHGENKRLFWDSFDTMTAANQRYYKAKRELGL
jgi:hypothetical protein